MLHICVEAQSSIYLLLASTDPCTGPFFHSSILVEQLYLKREIPSTRLTSTTAAIAIDLVDAAETGEQKSPVEQGPLLFYCHPLGAVPAAANCCAKPVVEAVTVVLSCLDFATVFFSSSAAPLGNVPQSGPTIPAPHKFLL